VADRSGVTEHHDPAGFEWHVRVRHEDAARLNPVDLVLAESALSTIAGVLDRLPADAPIEGTARPHAPERRALPSAEARA
jgi:hypothetical protein